MNISLKKFCLAFLLLGSISLAILLIIGYSLAAPHPTSVGNPPTDLAVQSVSIPSVSGFLHGWLIFGKENSGAVVLLHGIRADRRSMLSRAHFLHAAGYTVLLFDFQAHGESPGKHITFGAREALDARAAVKFLRAWFPQKPLAAIGTSLGSAAAILGTTPLPIDALIIEEVYTTIEQAVRNRLKLRLGSLGELLAPLLTLQIEPQTNVSPKDLRPIDKIHLVTAPILLIAAASDQHTTISESNALFQQAPEPKEFWVVPNARHVDLHAYSPLEYETRVLDFLERHLKHE